MELAVNDIESSLSTPPPRELKPTEIVGSCATLMDMFPRVEHVAAGLDARTFSVVGRRGPDLLPLQPEVVVVTGDGKLTRMVPPSTPSGQWTREVFDIPRLVGAKITRVTASLQDPETGVSRLVVSIAAIDSRMAGTIIYVERTDQGWREIVLPSGPWITRGSVESTTGGNLGLGGGKLQVHYSCLKPDSSNLSINALALDNQGQLYGLALLDNPRGVDQLVSFAHDWELTLVRLQSPQDVQLAPAPVEPRQLRPPVLPIRFDFGRARTLRLPHPITEPDAGRILPITDTRGLCHGLLFRGDQGVLMGCRVGAGGVTEPVSVLTGRGGPASVGQMACSFGADGTLHLFVADLAFSVWHCALPPGAPMDQAMWAAVGYQARQLQAPQLVPGVPLCFVQGNAGQLYQVSYLPEEGEWVRTQLFVPASPEAEPAQVHTIQLSAIMASGEGVPGVPLRVRSDRPVLVEYEGAPVLMSPERPLTMATGGMGTVRFRVKVDGLHAPQISVMSPALPDRPEYHFRPEQDALRRLAGLDPRFVVDAASLKRSGIVPADLPDDQAVIVADNLRASARAALAGGGGGAGDDGHRKAGASKKGARTSVKNPSGLVMSRLGGRVEIHRLTRAGQVPAVVARRARGLRGMADGELSQVSASSSGSFWSWLKGAWDTATQFVVKVVDKVVEFVVTGANEVVRFVARSVQAIREGIHAVVAWLGELAQDLVDAGARVVGWVAEKLGWDEVIRAKRLVKAYTLTSLTELERLVGRSLPRLISAGLADAKASVGEFFDKAINSLGSTTAGNGANNPHQYQAALRQNGAKVMVINDAVPQTPMEEGVFQFSPELKAKFLNLGEQAKTFGQRSDLQDLLHTFSRLIQGKTSLSDGLALILGDLLKVSKNLVLLALDVADTLQTLILEVVAMGIRLIRDALSAPVTRLGAGFNWVNRLYKNISGGDDLSLVDLGCLVFVAPGVILHHILVGRELVPANTEIPTTGPSIVASFDGLIQAYGSAAEVGEGGPLTAAPPTPALSAGIDEQKFWGPGVKAFWKILSPVMAWCGAIWSLIRTVVSFAENALRVADCENEVISAKPRAIFTWIVRVADWGLMLASVTEMVSARIDAILDFMNTTLGRALGCIAAVVLLCVLAFTEQVIALGNAIMAIPPVVSVWVLALFSLPLGGALLLYYVINLVLGPGQVDDPARKKFYFAASAGVVFQLRKFVQLGVPVGVLLVKTGEPVSVGIGAVLITANFGGDPLSYLTGGSLQVCSLMA